MLFHDLANFCLEGLDIETVFAQIFLTVMCFFAGADVLKTLLKLRLELGKLHWRG